MTASWIEANNRSEEGVENIRRYKSARGKAMVRLAHLHPDEFRELFEEERAKLPPAYEIATRPRLTAEEELREMYGI